MSGPREHNFLEKFLPFEYWLACCYREFPNWDILISNEGGEGRTWIVNIGPKDTFLCAMGFGDSPKEALINAMDKARKEGVK